MKKIKGWNDYYRITKDNPPTPLLIRADSYVKEKKNALELGAGTPRDTLFLLKQGYIVTAVDKEVGSQLFFKELDTNKKFTFVLNSFEEFCFQEEQYDLVSAQRSLPFIPNKRRLIKITSEIMNALKPKGIFAGHFFGVKDTWSKEGKAMSFVKKSEIDKMFSTHEVVELNEIEKDSTTAKGTPHHWHIFEVIIKK